MHGARIQDFSSGGTKRTVRKKVLTFFKSLISFDRVGQWFISHKTIILKRFQGSHIDCKFVLKPISINCVFPRRVCPVPRKDTISKCCLKHYQALISVGCTLYTLGCRVKAFK